MKEIENIGPNLDLVKLDGKSIYLVGTAHVSQQSADLAEHAIRTYQPDTVCLELCDARYQSLRDPNRWRNTDIVQVIRSGKAYVLLAQLVLATFQKKLAKQFQVKPGEEMLRSIAVAEEQHARIALVDREVKTTLRRAWAGASIWSAIRMFGSLIVSMLCDDREIKEADIEKLKQADVMTALMDEFSQYLPGVKKGLIDERDLYMASKIAETEGNVIVAVLGAGHIPGIKAHIGEQIDRAALEAIPKPRLATKLFNFGLPGMFILVLFLGFFHSGGELTTHMIKIWVLTTGSLAAVGALIALAHPLTILSAFIAAPITTLHPLIAVGGVCAVVEAYLRKPQVKDLETIGDDLQTWQGWWKNRVSRILIIFILANLGGTIGVLLGGTSIVSSLVH